MYDQELLGEKLHQISDALAKIARRFETIQSADDFLDSEHGQDMLDSICMMLIAVGENFKSIEQAYGRKIARKISGHKLERCQRGTRCDIPPVF